MTLDFTSLVFGLALGALIGYLWVLSEAERAKRQPKNCTACGAPKKVQSK